MTVLEHGGYHEMHERPAQRWAFAVVAVGLVALAAAPLIGEGQAPEWPTATVKAGMLGVSAGAAIYAWLRGSPSALRLFTVAIGVTATFRVVGYAIEGFYAPVGVWTVIVGLTGALHTAERRRSRWRHLCAHEDGDEPERREAA